LHALTRGLCNLHMPRDSFGPWPPPLRLYPFRYRDRLTGKWIRARYRAERDVIAAQYQEWELTGPPEVRQRGGESFDPWR
jgi:hypothetical protein